MHSNETRDKFIELRAQNISLRKIADQLGVHRNTLLQWDQEYRDHIDHLRLVELEALQERILPKYEQELTDVAEEYRRVTAELRTRECSHQPTALLARRQLALLSQMNKMRLQVRTKRPIPPSE